jgi:hypothetical protein
MTLKAEIKIERETSKVFFSIHRKKSQRAKAVAYKTFCTVQQ